LARVNPLAQIPTLVLPDGGVVTESAAILIHLGLAYPGSPLLPADAARRAQALRGLVYIAANCYAAIGVIDYPERWCADADEHTKKRIQAGTRARLHALWDTFADTFPAQPFLAGAQPGALDLLAAVVSKWSGSRQTSRRRGRHSPRCSRASKPIRASRRCSRATGPPPHDRRKRIDACRKRGGPMSAAEPPQGANSAPFGGSAAANAASVGVPMRGAGPPQVALYSPFGGSAAANAASVGGL
jgi:glutathione S-transferase